MNIIQTVAFDDQKRRAFVVQRDDGSFGFDERHASDDPSKPDWIPIGDHTATRIDDTSNE